MIITNIFVCSIAFLNPRIPKTSFVDYVFPHKYYYAPPSRPKGPRRGPDKGNAGGALVFLMLLWLLYALGLYT